MVYTAQISKQLRFVIFSQFFWIPKQGVQDLNITDQTCRK